MAIHNVGDVSGCIGLLFHFRAVWQEAQRNLGDGDEADYVIWRDVSERAERSMQSIEFDLRSYLHDDAYHFPRVERT